MKRWIALALCLFMLLWGGLALAESAELVDEMQQGAMDALAAMIEGDVAAVTAQFDDTMAAAVSEDLLAAGWESVLAQLGGVTGVSAVQADADSRSVAVQLAHERGGSVFMLAYDEAGQIASMYIAPVTQAPEAQTRALPEGVTAQAVTLFAGTERELSGELLLPANAGAETAYVVLAHGSGPSDMDETVGGNKPLRDLAYDLAALGVGTLRFDKVTYAHPELPVATIDEEYTQPVAEALRVLREETGAVASELIPLGPFYPTCAYSTEVIHMFLARGLTFGERELDEDEFLNVFRMPLRELVEKILNGEIPDAKTQAAALRAWCMLKEGKLS